MDDGATQSAERRASAVLGRVIAGKFLIESYVGGGAMGAVYKARQVALDKDVAVKLLHGEHAGDATFAARFQREARAASKLDHPNSMRVIDFGQEPDGLLYIAMEYLDGRDLFHVIREDWPIPAGRAADIASQALAALAVAHDMGIVHRDLKPENIMMLRGTDDEGRPRDIVKVCDFGIAKFTESREAPGGGGQKLTSQGIVVGTPEYMSPEQGKGEALDARSDLYAVGVILYQLLTGRVPFDAETALGVVLKHVTEEPTPPRTVNPLADERLEAICLKAMRKKREDRYQTAREMRQDLRAVLGAADPLAHAATVELSASAVATAPTALAIDSSQVAAAASASKLTPSGTVTDSTGVARSGGRTVVVVVAALALTGGGVATWMVRGRSSHPAPPALAAVMSHAEPPTQPQPTPIEPVRSPHVDPAPLEPKVTPTAKASPRPPAVPVSKPALAPAATTAAPPPPSPPPPVPVVREPPPPPAAAAPPPAAPTAAPAPSPTAAPPPAPAFDPSHAHVDWSVVGAGGGATPGAVQRALSRHAPSWTQCYRGELERRTQRIEGSAVLHLTTDESGNVVGAEVRGFDAMPGVKGCIANAARVHVDGVDTGDAWADVQLTFHVE